MHLLYFDEAGLHDSKYFVLAGAAVFERQTYWLAKELDAIQAESLPDVEELVEFHASEIRAGKKHPWSKLEPMACKNILDRVYEKISESKVTLFAIAIERAWFAGREEAGSEYSFALESLLKRFDSYLARIYKESEEPQRGLVIMATSHLQRRLELIAMELREQGTRWGDLYNLSEIPLFTSSKNSRLLQVADFCANAVFGRYEAGFTRHFDKLVPKFDLADGVMHGLGHMALDTAHCFCPACMSRR